MAIEGRERDKEKLILKKVAHLIETNIEYLQKVVKVSNESLVEFKKIVWQDSSSFDEGDISQAKSITDNEQQKVLSKEKINKLIEIVKDNIDNAFDNILDAKFDINPKRVGKDNIGCSFCKYSDICFMKEEDVVSLEEHNNLDFL